MDNNDNHNLLDVRTRSNITYILVISAMLMLGYIVYRWGQEKEILTLIIGLIGGTMLGVPLGLYYSGNAAKKPDAPVIQQTGENATANAGSTDEVK